MRNHLAALGEDESCQLLASSTRCPLVTCVAGQPEIFPVNLVTQGPSLLSHRRRYQAPERSDE
jgi:hypothetical protein